MLIFNVTVLTVPLLFLTVQSFRCSSTQLPTRKLFGKDCFVRVGVEQQLGECSYGQRRFWCQKFEKKSVRVDEEDALMKVGGVEVVKVKVENKIMKIDWIDTWEHWTELHNSSELKDLKLKHETALKNSGVKGKGGKGKASF